MAEKKQEHELVHEATAEFAGAPTALEVQLDSQKAIARIGAIAQVIEGCVKTSIQRTNPNDWVRMTAKNGKESFYLQATGAQKIRPIWGIYYRDRKVTKEVNEGGSYSYIVEGEVGSKVLDQLYGEVVVPIDGGRSSSDGFFAGRDGSKSVDPLDVRKASLANWESRAVTALLGLKNVSAADLTKNGIDPKLVPGYAFKEGAEGGGGNAKGLISEAQQKRLFAIASSAGVTNDQVKAYLKEKYKIGHSSEIKRDDYDAICKAVQGGELKVIQLDEEPGSKG